MNDEQQFLKSAFFARHETFCPRYGWLKKGFDRVAGYNGHGPQPRVFDAANAIEQLGVGKNMVRSIRFWCLAFKVIENEKPTDSPRIGGEMKTSEFGKSLLADQAGWDPYLEDPASLWLLHWKLFTMPVLATAWTLVVNSGVVGSFSMEDLENNLLDHKEKIPNFRRYSTSSIQKDASCFIRMYAPPGKQASEEIDCPFTHLELLVTGDRIQSYRFNLNDKPSLPDEILFAACCDYTRELKLQGKSINLNRLVYGYNSPGVVFKLSESAIGNRLERCTAKLTGVEFRESFGNRQLYFHHQPEALYQRALSQYFEENIRTEFK